MVTPAMRRFASLSLDQLRELSHSPKLNVAEAIAVTTLVDALTRGPFTTGIKSRETVLDRLDGQPQRASVEVQVGVSVALKWDDGSPAS